MNSSINDLPPGAAAVVRVPTWKRVLDIALILLALPILLPVMIGIAIMIRLVSRGPVLFKQERIGLQGSRFMCLKFRTMVVGNDTAVHRGHLDNLINSDKPMVKMDLHGDPRIIRFGVPLRATGLDELPQLINVLRGEMSLVGPRPCVAYEYAKYLPWQKERFDTLPGLTGNWQVNGKNRTTFEQMIRLDIDYVRKKSLWMDLKIIFMTIPALVGQVRDTRRRKKTALAQPAAHPQPAVSAKPAMSVAGAGGEFQSVLHTESRR